MIAQETFTLADVEQRVCDIASENLGIARAQAVPESRIVDDLGVDSLDLVELFMSIEDAFGVSLPGDPPNAVYAAVFTRVPFRLSDLAELVYLQLGVAPKRRAGPSHVGWHAQFREAPFTQLEGRWLPGGPLVEPLASKALFRRRSDGMRCILVPAASVEIGCGKPNALADQQPLHQVELDAFLIDAEPVSTTAYCRFLNSIGDVDEQILAEWFLCAPRSPRNDWRLIRRDAGVWEPAPGTQRWPMIMVSWYGASAYALWANGVSWRRYRAGEFAGRFLPSEAQWEYAARGPAYRDYPWGDAAPTSELMCHGQHRRGRVYAAPDAFPMVDVNACLGMSPFGLHHMAGNVWQWCRDWYDDRFYGTSATRHGNPANDKPTGIRSERGGSWVGPASLCRSSYRRGRPPQAFGRCLGFRCITTPLAS